MANKIPVIVAGITFDALLEESRTLAANIPEYTVEDGYVISDSIIIQPETLDLTLFVTDTPVSGTPYYGRASDIAKKLELKYFEKEVVTVQTTEKTYSNMGITSLSIQRSADVGYAREISLSLKKVAVTQTKTTTIPASYGKSGKSKTSAGTANTAAASSSTGSGSNGENSAGSATGKEKSGSVLYNLASMASLL